jgi:hypothetical protein
MDEKARNTDNWFKLKGKLFSSRSSRNSPAVDSVTMNVSYENCCPYDQVSLAKIYEYHNEMENGRNHYAKRFPPYLRRQIPLLEELENRRKELLQETAYDEQA